MSDPYVGEIKFFGFPFAPRNWVECNGASVALRQWTSLFALIGTTFGGDGVQAFQLPNLAGRSPVGSGLGTGLGNRQIGQAFGEANVTLQSENLPPHIHTFQAFASSDNPTTGTPTASAALSLCSGTAYTMGQTDGSFDPAAVSPTGGGQPHANVQPVLGLMPAIALLGIWPDFG